MNASENLINVFIKKYANISSSCVCSKIVKQIDLWGIDVVFVIGGIGGNAGAYALRAELERSNVICSVVGIPKSIDNDILLVSKLFFYLFCLLSFHNNANKKNIQKNAGGQMLWF